MVTTDLPVGDQACLHGGVNIEFGAASWRCVIRGQTIVDHTLEARGCAKVAVGWLDCDPGFGLSRLHMLGL